LPRPTAVSKPGSGCVAGLVDLFDLPLVGLHFAQTLGQHIPDAPAAFECDDVPGEGEEIPPAAFIGEQRLKVGLVARGKRSLEVREPARGLLI
jgi:hypothetical protein